MGAFFVTAAAHSATGCAKKVSVVVVALTMAACGSRPHPEAFIWLNPAVEERCTELQQVKEHAEPGGNLPRDFPLPKGSSIVGSAPGVPPTVHVTAPGDFLHLDSFFKSELENRGWAGGSSGNGSDPSGRYGYVLVNGHGWRGEVSVVQCQDDEPEILIELEEKASKKRG